LIYEVVLCLGDSLTYGSRDEYGKGYPQYLGEYLSRDGVETVTVNEGVPGETSSDILRRAYRVASSYPDAKEVVVQFGTNDAKDEVATPVEVFRQNLLGVHRALAVNGKRMYMCTIPDLVGRIMPNYTAAGIGRIAEYNRVIEGFCGLGKAVMVEWRGVDASMYSDGVHFNSRGYTELATRVGNAILAARRGL